MPVRAVVLSVSMPCRRAYINKRKYYNARAICKGELFGEGFGERLSHRGGRGGVCGGVSGGCSGLRGDCGSGFVSVSVGTASSASNSGPISDTPDSSRGWPRPPAVPMTSSTMLPRSTAWDGDVSGSVSCDAADGGGHTLSWKIEPDSDARGRNRRGGDDGTGEPGRPCGISDSCEYAYA